MSVRSQQYNYYPFPIDIPKVVTYLGTDPPGLHQTHQSVTSKPIPCYHRETTPINSLPSLALNLSQASIPVRGIKPEVSVSLISVHQSFIALFHGNLYTRKPFSESVRVVGIYCISSGIYVFAFVSFRCNQCVRSNPSSMFF